MIEKAVLGRKYMTAFITLPFLQKTFRKREGQASYIIFVFLKANNVRIMGIISTSKIDSNQQVHQNRVFPKNGKERGNII